MDRIDQIRNDFFAQVAGEELQKQQQKDAERLAKQQTCAHTYTNVRGLRGETTVKERRCFKCGSSIFINSTE